MKPVRDGTDRGFDMAKPWEWLWDSLTLDAAFWWRSLVCSYWEDAAVDENPPRRKDRRRLRGRRRRRGSVVEMYVSAGLEKMAC